MTNGTARYIVEYIRKNNLSAERISEKLNIPIEKLILETKECLTGEEFLRLCCYLHIRPEKVSEELGI